MIGGHLLIDESTLHRMEQAIAAGMVPSIGEQIAYQQEYFAQQDGVRGLTVAGDTAAIEIRGVLTGAPDFFGRMFGGNTVYQDIRTAIAAAEADPAVNTIEFDIASPGGEASAEWQATMDAIAAIAKPTRAFVRDRALSAAYGLASQADEIVAANDMASVGSVGVVATLRNPEMSSLVQVTSSNAPDKRPDPTTEEGKAVIRREIDQIEAKFTQMIATGREVSEADVRDNFGRGATVLARMGLKNGMIDSISQNSTPQSTDNPPPTGATMDLKTLEAEHPAVYAAAVATGVEQGVSQERERVTAHLELGASSGANDIAIAAIKDGTEHSATMNAKYTAAHMASAKAADQRADGADTAAAAAQVANNNTHQSRPNAADELNQKTVELVEERLGIDPEG